MPEVSIVIPVHNRPGLVVEAIESCLGQPCDAEIIVVDDGSTDETPSVLRRFGSSIRVLTNSSAKGAPGARNQGLAAARAEYVKFLDSDDALCRDSLRLEIDGAVAERADLVFAGWATSSLDDSSLAPVSHSPPDFSGRTIIDGLLSGKAVPTSAALYQRRLATATQWDPELRKLQDWDFFVRAALQSERPLRLEHVSYLWRHHSGPRVGDASSLVNAVAHHTILGKLERSLKGAGQLTAPRRLRLAQYYYKELQVLAEQDKESYRAAWAKILSLDPGFLPRDEESRRHLRILSRLFGVPLALQLHLAARRVLKRR